MLFRLFFLLSLQVLTSVDDGTGTVIAATVGVTASTSVLCVRGNNVGVRLVWTEVAATIGSLVAAALMITAWPTGRCPLRHHGPAAGASHG